LLHASGAAASSITPASATGPAAVVARRDAARRIMRALRVIGLTAEVFAEVEQLLEVARPLQPVLVVLAAGGQDATPASLVARVARELGDVGNARIVLYCPAIERWDVRAALAAGAAGIVFDRDGDDALGACLAAVHAGQTCVPREHARQIDPPALSTREKQILGLLVMGYMNSQIAERLYLAESTVKSHLSSAFGKLGVRSRNQAVDLILDPERGLGIGILGLVGERIETGREA
jgi:DNA-binding NarL/FixJ family response regulator